VLDLHRGSIKTAALCLCVIMVLYLLPTRIWPQSKSHSTPKPAASSYLPLSQYGLKNVVTGINYPNWFGDSTISATDREYLVGLFNEREWIRFQDSLSVATDPHITLSNGQTVNLQPIIEALEAVGSALTADSSEVEHDKRGRLRLKPREGQEMDTPAEAESSGNADIDIIDKELRWYRQRKYRIPPTISARNCGKQPPFDAICSSLPLWIRIAEHDVNFFGSRVDDCKRMGLATCMWDDAYQRSVKGLAEDRAHREKCEAARSSKCAREQ
jgi:hypothetical protein